ncbi:hypothetical protein MUK42_29903 [Musa troglodytarum]|uniref:Uncharacterized protein n=1 Tax=Musa troglodytarum TaxID=320322 RepID=A0A9E7FJ18_9LILI|nr:hypothetical protein MUK42_29903 [Musa troglodytarum]
MKRSGLSSLPSSQAGRTMTSRTTGTPSSRRNSSESFLPKGNHFNRNNTSLSSLHHPLHHKLAVTPLQSPSSLKKAFLQPPRTSGSPSPLPRSLVISCRIHIISII